MKKEVIIGTFQSKAEHFGFVIPDERTYWGGDFFVHKSNFNGAKDGNRVEAELLTKSKGQGTIKFKKPEAKIIEIFTGRKNIKLKKVLKIVEGIYSGGDGNFGFIDIEGQEKGYFVYGKKKNGAQDGNRVKAEIVEYNGKEEAIVFNILKQEEEFIEGIYKDNEKFGFVLPNNKSGDIFIAGSRKGEAKNRDKVEVKIIKRGGKNPEGVINRILK